MLDSVRSRRRSSNCGCTTRRRPQNDQTCVVKLHHVQGVSLPRCESQVGCPSCCSESGGGREGEPSRCTREYSSSVQSLFHIGHAPSQLALPRLLRTHHVLSPSSPFFLPHLPRPSSVWAAGTGGAWSRRRARKTHDKQITALCTRMIHTYIKLLIDASGC